MKYLLIFFVCFGYSQTISDSLTLDVVDNPAYYYITVNGDTLSNRYTKESKAILEAGKQSIISPNKDVVLLRPKALFSSQGSVSIDLSDIYKNIDTLKFAIKYQAEALSDVYTKEIPALKRKIDYLDSLNKKKIDRIMVRLENMESPLPIEDDNLLKLDSVSVTRGGWVINSNNNYTFSPFLENLGYLEFKTPVLELGNTYELSFDIESDTAVIFSVWIYESPFDIKPINWVSGKVFADAMVNSGLFQFEYTVDIMDRKNVAIRARNESGKFTISNVKLVKK